MLPSEIIRRVKEIQVRTGRQVADVLAGEYVSVFRGTGIEFDEVRPYIPGDDIRSIDWNVTARTSVPYVKRYVEERQLTMMLVADISASQDFGSGLRSKREATAELCALLAFSAIQNDDNVGLILFHGDVEQYIPPRKGQKHALRVVREVLAHGQHDLGQHDLDQHDRGQQDRGQRHQYDGGVSRTVLGSAVPRSIGTRLSALGRRFAGIGRRRLRSARQSTSITKAMQFLLGVTKRKSVCFVVSDFLDEGFEQALAMANRRHDVIAVLISDPRELQLPDVGLVALRDAESGRARVYDSSSATFTRQMRAASEQRVAALESRLRATGIDFIHIDASESIVEPLVRFFRGRERRSRR